MNATALHAVKVEPTHLARAPDTGQAVRFLLLLDPDAVSFTFQTFDDRKERKDESLTCIRHLQEPNQKLTDLQGKGAGIFVTVNETDGAGRKSANIQRVRAIWQE